MNHPAGIIPDQQFAVVCASLQANLTTLVESVALEGMAAVPVTSETLGWLCGVDLVNVSSFARALNLTRGRLVEVCFSDRERADAQGRPERLAARWAVKEAVGKALGTGLMNGVAFLDVETLLSTDGAPSLALHDGAARAAEDLGIAHWAVSTSHDGGLAIAMVVASQRRSQASAGRQDHSAGAATTE